MSTQFSRLKKTDLTPEEQALFDELSDRMELNISDPAELRNAYQNLNAMKGVIQGIDTKRGRQYALSRLLNDPKYGFDSELYKRENPHLDAWDLKYQEDFKPIDVLREEAKLDNEQFYDEESPRHWSKRSPSELKERAMHYGYTDVPAYLEQVRKDQTAIDREKRFEEEAHKGFWNGGEMIPLPAALIKAAYPRASEAVLRGDDIKGKDLALDVGEQALYATNPGGRVAGRAAQALSKGKDLGRAGKFAVGAIDAVANPAIMEAADASLYDDPNNDRSEFSKADVGMGAAINAGMGSVVKSLYGGELPKPKWPEKKFETEVSKQTRNAVSNQKRNATKELQNMGDIMADAFAKGEDLNKFGEQLVKNRTLSKSLDLPKIQYRDRTARDFLPEIKKSGVSIGLPLVSNKIGDELTEHPDLAKKVIRRGIHLPGVNLAAPLVDAYYDAKKPETEKEKLERLYGAQF